MTHPTAWALSRLGLVLCRAETIHRKGGPADGVPYLQRFTLFKCRWFGLMLHRFLSSDDECLHDHPFPFVSIILRGGYAEWSFNPLCAFNGIKLARRWYGPGRVLFRRANWAHRIEIDERRPAWTLVLTGPRSREWGFFTRFGWLPWREYSYHEHCS